MVRDIDEIPNFRLRDMGWLKFIFMLSLALTLHVGAR
jgi:hypothetical protein